MLPDKQAASAHRCVIARGLRCDGFGCDAVIGPRDGPVRGVAVNLDDGIVVTRAVLNIVQDGVLEPLPVLGDNGFKHSGELGGIKRAEPTGETNHGC